MDDLFLDRMFTDKDEVFGRVLVLNLKKDKRRWKDICYHLAQWNIFPERYESISDIKIPSLPDHMNKANACLDLTHAAASRHCLLNSQRNFWLVLEDDCRFVEDPRKVVLNAIWSLEITNQDWSVISLGSYSKYIDKLRLKPESYLTHVLEKPRGWKPWGSHALLVNRRHALSLIQQWSSCMYPADHTLIREYEKGAGFLLRPSAAYQEEYTSKISKGINPTKKNADVHPFLLEKICNTKSNQRLSL